MRDISLVIPCYNEEDNIPLIVQRCREIKPDDFDLEIVLVDNGSKDHTSERIIELTKEDALFSYVRVDTNLGYGFGILSGLEKATGEYLAWTHADMQTDPLDVVKGFRILRNRGNTALFLKGSRQNRALIPWLFTFGMSLVAYYALKTWLADIGAQPKIFHRSFYEKYLKNQAPYDFSLDLFAMYQAKKHGEIISFPVVFLKRQHGEAKGGGSLRTRLKVSQRVFRFIFELRRKIKSQSS